MSMLKTTLVDKNFEIRFLANWNETTNQLEVMQGNPCQIKYWYEYVLLIKTPKI